MPSVRLQVGDVVIRSKHYAEVFFAISVWGASSREITCAKYDDALKLAKRTAAPTHSDVWYSDDDLRFDLVASYRQSLL